MVKEIDGYLECEWLRRIYTLHVLFIKDFYWSSGTVAPNQMANYHVGSGPYLKKKMIV